MAEKHIKHYPNGATLIYYRQNINSTTDATIAFLCGSKRDGKKHGLAHALEHSIFDGLDSVKKEDLYQTFRQTGTVQNAFTSRDYIATEFNTPNDSFEKILKLNSEMFSKKNFSESEWNRERKVILQELFMTVDEERTDLTKKINLNNNILGNPKTLNKITTQDFVDYSNKYFITDNMVVSIVSSLPYNQVKKAVEDNFINKFPSNWRRRINVKKKPIKIEDKQVVIDIPDAQSFDIQFMFKGINGVEKNDLYTRFEDWYFNDFAGKLYEKFRLKEPLVYTASFQNYPVLNSNLKIFSIKTSPSNVNRCIDVMTEILRDVIINGVSEEDFKLFKDTMLAERARKTNIKTYKSSDLFFDFIYGKKPFVRDFFNKLMDLKREDVNKNLKRVYGKSKLVVMLAGDIVKGQKIIDETYPLNVVSDEKLWKDLFGADMFYSHDEILDKYKYYQILGIFDELEKMKSPYFTEEVKEYTGKLPKVKRKQIVEALEKTKIEKQEKEEKTEILQIEMKK